MVDPYSRIKSKLTTLNCLGQNLSLRRYWSLKTSQGGSKVSPSFFIRFHGDIKNKHTKVGFFSNETLSMDIHSVLLRQPVIPIILEQSIQIIRLLEYHELRQGFIKAFIISPFEIVFSGHNSSRMYV